MAYTEDMTAVITLKRPLSGTEKKRITDIGEYDLTDPFMEEFAESCEDADPNWLGLIAGVFCDEKTDTDGLTGLADKAFRAFCDGTEILNDSTVKIYYRSGNSGDRKFFDALMKKYPDIASVTVNKD